MLTQGQIQVSIDVSTLLGTAADCLCFVTETYGVVPKWKRLEELDPESQEYLLLLSSILDSPTDRRATAALKGGGAEIVLDIIAGVRVRSSIRVGNNTTPISLILISFCLQVIDGGGGDDISLSRAIKTLLQLTNSACQVPTCHKIDRRLVFDVDPAAFARGGHSDARRGSLGDQLVVVKTLRMPPDSDVSKVQGVRYTQLCFFLH